MSHLLVIATIAGRRCALRAGDVQSVIDLGTITPVPCTPDFVSGITALRSQALTVIDARRAIGFTERDWPSDHRAVVVWISGHSYALQVDAIEDVESGTVDTSEVPGGFGSRWARVARGMIETGAGPALLIDLPTLIVCPENSGEAA